MRTASVFFALAGASVVLSRPTYHVDRRSVVVGRSALANVARSTTTLDGLLEGNKAFRDEMAGSEAGLLQKLADEGQAPPFFYLGCSDSRVNEGTVFKSKPGTFFSSRNIANQYHKSDVSTESVLSYGVSVLGVEHVIVMGHYGCGGVAAAIASPPKAPIDAANGLIQAWIEPIREVFAKSTRPEIVELREKISGQSVVEEPEIKEPGFRALVEENVKAGVARIATDSVLVNHYALLANSTEPTPAVKRRSEAGPPKDVFVHGFVYDIETGLVHNLGVSVGPSGKEIPAIPFEAVAKAAEDVAGGKNAGPPSVTSPGLASTTRPVQVMATVY